VRINGVRFTVVGSMDTKFRIATILPAMTSRSFLPYSTAGDLWDARYASVMIFEPVAPAFEPRHARCALPVANRQPLFSERPAGHYQVRAAGIQPIMEESPSGSKRCSF